MTAHQPKAPEAKRNPLRLSSWSWVLPVVVVMRAMLGGALKRVLRGSGIRVILFENLIAEGNIHDCSAR